MTAMLDRLTPYYAGFRKFCRVAGALFACVGVIMGAVIAHLPEVDFGPGGRVMAHTALEMQMWHSIAIVVLGLAPMRASRLTMIGMAGLLVGTLLFCSAVYATAFTGMHFGYAAPWGGSLLIGSWAVLAVAFCRHD